MALAVASVVALQSTFVRHYVFVDGKFVLAGWQASCKLHGAFAALEDEAASMSSDDEIAGDVGVVVAPMSEDSDCGKSRWNLSESGRGTEQPIFLGAWLLRDDLSQAAHRKHKPLVAEIQAYADSH